MGRTSKKVRDAYRLVAEHADGARGLWAYDAFDTINERYFDNALPLPVIRWALTPHSGCIGMTQHADAVPVITLHPSILGGTEKKNPWEVSGDLLGPTFAFDVLLHETIHIAVEAAGRGRVYQTGSSHNNDGWVAEVNRIAPLVGLKGIEAAPSVVKRVKVEGHKYGKTARVCEGSISFKAVSTFPHGARLQLGKADWYRRTHRHIPKLS